MEEKLETLIQHSIPEKIKDKLNIKDIVSLKGKVVASYLGSKGHKIPKPLFPRPVSELLSSKGISKNDISKMSMMLRTKLNASYAQAGGRRTRKVKTSRRRRMTRRH